ncbi:zinc-ribbon domain-containing protein [Citreicella sp. C3M06]|uniref:zinc-ribbon domain-containing protein n=1 Tax=Citreicella sp. C3M06 TaxID=2841564 RepID=UPI001C09C518|nr:zinc-ribbon domain-containing protein [Citreicella sp. C3M06]MBU2960906.1 zinc-ribbon domain-containing protein [Citreicella sp. C3M06]
MRLICPNCDAQYEVPTNVIPAGGRDVQCSNCGHTWFQDPPDKLPADATSTDDSWDSGPEPAQGPEPQTDFAPEPEAQRQPRSLDPSVLEVLREEAEREQRQRIAEAESLETQPDLGLSQPDEDEPTRRARESRERMAQIKGEAPAASTAVHSRRDLLPDIEEINQTLRATPERRTSGGHDMSTPQGRAALAEDMSAERDGFGKGFRLAIVAVMLAVLLYAIAPTVIAMVPALGAVLDPYVGAITGLRHWLDGQIVALLQMLDGMSSEASAL